MTLQPTNSILVMWSGGIDSTYILAKLLKETDKKVFAHHIYLRNVEDRQTKEAEAIEKLIVKLRAIRKFNFTRNIIDDSAMPTMVYDMARVCFEAGAVSKAFYHWIKPFAIDEWTIGTNKEEGHWQERWDIIAGATRAAEWTPGRKDFIRFQLQPMVSKREEMEYLESLGLLKDCWFCRVPKEGQSCGQCKTCLEVKDSLKEKIWQTSSQS